MGRGRGGNLKPKIRDLSLQGWVILSSMKYSRKEQLDARRNECTRSKRRHCFSAVCVCVYVHVQGGRVIPSRAHNACPERFLNAKTCCVGHLEQHLYAILSLLLSPANKMRFRWKTEAATVTQAG